MNRVRSEYFAKVRAYLPPFVSKSRQGGTGGTPSGIRKGVALNSNNQQVIAEANVLSRLSQTSERASRRLTLLVLRRIAHFFT
jgi:hypothetical protein